MDDPSLWAERLPGSDRDILLVGHLPHLSKLASLLLLWDPGRDIIDFTPGTVLCLEMTDNWKVKWMLSPHVLKGENGVQCTVAD
jgi:phosphohistidine phosphatase